MKPTVTLWLIPILCLSSCLPLPDMTPRFTRNKEEVFSDMAATGQFSDYTFEVTAHFNNSGLEAKELDLTLIGGKDLPRSEAGLDSLARKAATILVRAIENRKDYDLITIEFAETSDTGEVPSDRKKVFAYFPTELK